MIYSNHVADEGISFLRLPSITNYRKLHGLQWQKCAAWSLEAWCLEIKVSAGPGPSETHRENLLASSQLLAVGSDAGFSPCSRSTSISASVLTWQSPTQLPISFLSSLLRMTLCHIGLTTHPTLV